MVPHLTYSKFGNRDKCLYAKPYTSHSIKIKSKQNLFGTIKLQEEKGGEVKIPKETFPADRPFNPT